MAIAALVLWICTVAIGVYLLASATRVGRAESAPAESVPATAGQAASGRQAVGLSSLPVSAKDPFAPPSLQRDRAEPLPGMKEVAEFVHPALGLVGLGFWMGYAISRNSTFLAIGLGFVIGTIAAGVSWATVNAREAKRAAAEADDVSATGDSGTEYGRIAPLSFTPLVLTLHVIGAALTLLFVVLIFTHA